MAEIPVRHVALLCLVLALPGCGKKGPLYLPDTASEVVTRPAETTPASENTEAPNSPQTTDSQPAAPPAAPEVTRPEEDPKKDKGTTPPPEPPPQK